MFLFKPARWLALVASLTTATIHAQTGATPQGAVPPAAAAAHIVYESTLEGYQPYRDERIKPWKESNDTVGKIGGWRAYAKEAAEATPPPSGTAPAAARATNPHAGHGKQ